MPYVKIGYKGKTFAPLVKTVTFDLKNIEIC